MYGQESTVETVMSVVGSVGPLALLLPLDAIQASSKIYHFHITMNCFWVCPTLWFAKFKISQITGIFISIIIQCNTVSNMTGALSWKMYSSCSRWPDISSEPHLDLPWTPYQWCSQQPEICWIRWCKKENSFYHSQDLLQSPSLIQATLTCGSPLYSSVWRAERSAYVWNKLPPDSNRTTNHRVPSYVGGEARCHNFSFTFKGVFKNVPDPWVSWIFVLLSPAFWTAWILPRPSRYYPTLAWPVQSAWCYPYNILMWHKELQGTLSMWSIAL